MRKRVLLILLPVAFLWILESWAAEYGLKAAFQVVVNGPLQGDTTGKRIYALKRMTTPGMVVELWRGSVTLPEATGFLFFVDDVPEANWEHPARLVFVNPSESTFQAYSVTTPPRIFQELTEMGQYVPKARQSRQKSTMQDSTILGNATPPVSGPQRHPRARATIEASSADSMLTVHPDHKFAVIISGGTSINDNSPRFWNDVSFIYKALKYKYGYKDENIYVLFADGQDPAIDTWMGWSSNVDLDDDGVPDIDFSATRDNVHKVFGELAERMKAEDLLFVFTTAHGGRPNPDTSPTGSTLSLWFYEEITDAEFAAEVNRITSYDTMVFVMEQCYSGGFADDLAGPDRIFISAAAYDQSSFMMWSNGDYYIGYCEFAYYFTCAVGGERPDGGAVQADMDGDGVVSMAEAYAFAKNNDISPESPQFQDQSRFADVDPLMGANVVSLDGRFGTSFTFESAEDVVSYSITMKAGSTLRIFVKEPVGPVTSGSIWLVSIGGAPDSMGKGSGSPLNWFSPAVARGKGDLTAGIGYATSYRSLPASGFVKFAFTGGGGKRMTVTSQH